MAKEYLHGTYSFDKFGEGFVAFRLIAPEGHERHLLTEMNLLIATQKRHRFTYEFEPDFKEFLEEHGYTSPVDIMRALRGDGLIMKNDRAIAFRMRFL